MWKCTHSYGRHFLFASDRVILLTKCHQTLTVIYYSTWLKLWKSNQPVPLPYERNQIQVCQKASWAKTTEAESYGALRACNVGAALSVVCEQGIARRTGPEIGASLCWTVGITDPFIGDQSSPESAVWLCAGAVWWCAAWPLSLTIPAETKNTTFCFGTQFAHNTLPFWIRVNILMATWTLEEWEGMKKI